VNGSVVPAAMVGFVGVTEIELRLGVLVEGGVPAQFDNKSRAQTESRTEVHRRLKCRRPAIIENPQRFELSGTLRRIHLLAQVYLKHNRHYGLLH
jgi:hypothetical protein